MTRLLDLRGHDVVKRTVVLLDERGYRDGNRTMRACDIEIQATLRFATNNLHIPAAPDHPRLWRVYWWAKGELERN